MAKISFYLTNSRSETETNLYCLINYGLYKNENGSKKYLPLKYYTDIKIHPRLWNKHTNRVSFSDNETLKAKPTETEINKINTKIETFGSTVKELIQTLCEKGNLPSHEELRKELDKILKPTKPRKEQIQTPTDLFTFIDFFISKSGRKVNTVKSYMTLKNNLSDYQCDSNCVLTFEKIDIDFYYSFIDYLSKPKKVKTKNGKSKLVSGLSNNTIGTRIKILKTFLSEAASIGIHVPNDYTKKSFKKPSEETSSIYLNLTELNLLYNKSGLPLYLEQVRDLFIIGCYTGLHFSDLTQIKKENISDDETIKIICQKTNTKVVVPLHPKVKKILEKYNYKLPQPPTNQKFNDYIKLVAEMTKINEPVKIERNIGRKNVNQTIEKFSLVTSHTARRSFATNAFLMGVPINSIMRITGHKTESTFLKYIKMSSTNDSVKSTKLRGSK